MAIGNEEGEFNHHVYRISNDEQDNPVQICSFVLRDVLDYHNADMSLAAQ